MCALVTGVQTCALPICSTLKLGQVRGVVMLAASLSGLPVAEYAPNAIKKAVVGTGHAAKEQIHAMVCVLLPGIAIDGAAAAEDRKSVVQGRSGAVGEVPGGRRPIKKKTQTTQQP